MPVRQPNTKKTKQHLAAVAEKVAKLLKDKPGVVDDYLDTIKETAFFRLAEQSPRQHSESVEEHRQRFEQIALDCLVLLVIAVSENSKLFSKVSKQDRGLFESATDLIAKQYSILENLTPTVWDSARIALGIANELAERDRLDVAERLLVALDKSTRKSIGAYFTPVELAEKLVFRTAEIAKRNFGLTNGFADLTSRKDVLRRLEIYDNEPSERDYEPRQSDQPFLDFLDPAAGVGTFLIACLRKMKADFNNDEAERSKLTWPDFLANAIGRVRGIELHPALAAICHFRLFNYYASELKRIPPGEIPIHCGDAICEPNVDPNVSSSKSLRASIVVGNPPFGALSVNSNSWIEGLLKGKVDGVSYFEVDGQPLNERKHWLHDDYVKFFRLAQYLVRRNRVGIVGFVSNRSYLDNLTFRAMRWQMLQQFREIEINELAGDAEHFPIVAGVASGIFCTHAIGQDSPMPNVNYRNETGVTRFSPSSPRFLFRPTVAVARNFLEATALPDAMPFHGSVTITARDHFVVDVDRETLKQRVAAFCDQRISDDEIRARYFQRTRSRRYPAGDTRSWKMTEARRKLKEIDWECHIRRCDYRPLDRRWVLWCDSMIDWPRKQNMSIFDTSGNFALLARRQSPANQPACYFWATNHITIDGILRSDNRGNETMFPVWILDSDGQTVPNFAESFLQNVGKAWKSSGVDVSDGDLPLTLAQYIYGLFHSANYRESFHQPLTDGFPRILLSPDRAETELLIDTGRNLLACHLRSTESTATENHLVKSNRDTDAGLDPELSGRIGYSAQERKITFGSARFDASPEDWEFRVGTHQVLRKWLKARTGLRASQVAGPFRQVLQCVRQTRELMQQIEQIEFDAPDQP